MWQQIAVIYVHVNVQENTVYQESVHRLVYNTLQYTRHFLSRCHYRVLRIPENLSLISEYDIATRFPPCMADFRRGNNINRRHISFVECSKTGIVPRLSCLGISSDR